MLERAVTRLGAVTAQPITTVQGDIRDIEFEAESFDIIMAAAVFHHLRGDDDWRSVFAKCYTALKPGGSIWISDLIEHDSPAIRALMWQRYGEYLTQLKGEAYRETVYSYIERERMPRPLLWQLHLLKEASFKTVEILHKNSVFRAFWGDQITTDKQARSMTLAQHWQRHRRWIVRDVLVPFIISRAVGSSRFAQLFPLDTRYPTQAAVERGWISRRIS